MQNTLVIAVVSDIHHGPDRYSKKGDVALELLKGFIRQVNSLEVGLVVDLGDRISNTDLETDRQHLAEVVSAFKSLTKECHHLTGNYYFERRYAHGERHRNASLARDLIEGSDKVIAVVSGHVHWNQLHVMDGIPHFSLQSLSETFTTHPHAAGSWALMTLGDTVEFEVFGHDPVMYRMPVNNPSHHWLPPME